MRKEKHEKIKSVFEKPDSITEPTDEKTETTNSGKVNKWWNNFPKIIEKKEPVINLICLITVIGYLFLIGVGYLVDLIKGTPHAINNLLRGFSPIVWGVIGWLFGSKHKTKDE